MAPCLPRGYSSSLLPHVLLMASFLIAHHPHLILGFRNILLGCLTCSFYSDSFSCLVCLRSSKPGLGVPSSGKPFLGLSAQWTMSNSEIHLYFTQRHILTLLFICLSSLLDCELPKDRLWLIYQLHNSCSVNIEWMMKCSMGWIVVPEVWNNTVAQISSLLFSLLVKDLNFVIFWR